MMDDELAQALIGIGCLLFIGIVGSIFWKAATCAARWTDYPHRWSVRGGCQVQVNGRWTPADAIRNFKA